MSTFPASLFKNITTLHGTKHFTDTKSRTNVFWSLVMLGITILTMAYLIVISYRYHNDQIVTRMNANCKVGQVPFPAVSICNFNLVSLRESESIAKILQGYNCSQQELQQFFGALPSLINYNTNFEEMDYFGDILNILKNHYYSIDTIMEEVHQPCEKLLLYCSFNRKKKSCNEMFSMIKTYEGHCCTFNYAALNDNRDKFCAAPTVYIFVNIPKLMLCHRVYKMETPLAQLFCHFWWGEKLSLEDDDVEYYVDPSANYEETNIISTSQSGRGSGLNVVFDVEPADYPPFSTLSFYGAKILLSDPNDYPEMTVLYRHALLGKALDIKVEPMIFQCDDEIRRVPVSKRGCWFHDEVDLEHTDRYSFETCDTECKMQHFIDVCGCIPYKYPSEKLYPVCEFKDLKCLSDFRAYKFKNIKPCDPPCLMECRDKKYTITSDGMPFVPDFYPPDITMNRNHSQLIALQVYFSKSTCNCYNQNLFIDFNYFIVTYGGVFSLSFGASILTMIELFYLISSFIIRKIIIFVSKLIKNKNM